MWVTCPIRRAWSLSDEVFIFDGRRLRCLVPRRLGMDHLRICNIDLFHRGFANHSTETLGYQLSLERVKGKLTMRAGNLSKTATKSSFMVLAVADIYPDSHSVFV